MPGTSLMMQVETPQQLVRQVRLVGGHEFARLHCAQAEGLPAG